MTSTQTIEVENKNGGPYTKHEQEKRRSQVYKLYFEKGHSAIKISEELGVNRNTVNSDIRILLSQAFSHLGQDKVAGAILRQTERLEIQRKRIFDFLDPKDFKKTITAEKILLDIDGKIASLLSRIDKSSKLEKFSATEEISEEEISKFVRDTVLSIGLPCQVSKSNILEKIISSQKCDLEHAENVFDKMISLGLDLKRTYGSSSSYYLNEFALMRGYLTEEDDEMMHHEREKELKKEERRIAKIEKKYSTKYGPDKTKWSPSVLSEMEDEKYG